MQENGDTLYFHFTPARKKTELLDKNLYVSISFVGKTEVLKLYMNEELQEIAKDKRNGDYWNKIFESTIMFGKVHKVENEEEIKFQHE